jgi:hypothetical protein
LRAPGSTRGDNVGEILAYEQNQTAALNAL